jgi:hypothetical protein
MASCRSPWEQDRYELLLTTRRKSAGCGGALMLAEPTTEVVTEWATTHPEVVTQSLRIDLVADLLRLLLSDNEARSEGVLAPVQEIVASLERIVSETFGTPIRVRPPYETDLTSRESRPPVGFADVDRALVVAMESHRTLFDQADDRLLARMLIGQLRRMADIREYLIILEDHSAAPVAHR